MKSLNGESYKNLEIQEDNMTYSKPIILNPAKVEGAKCSGSPCGRPKDGTPQRRSISDKKVKKN